MSSISPSSNSAVTAGPPPPPSSPPPNPPNSSSPANITSPPPSSSNPPLTSQPPTPSPPQLTFSSNRRANASHPSSSPPNYPSKPPPTSLPPANSPPAPPPTDPPKSPPPPSTPPPSPNNSPPPPTKKPPEISPPPPPTKKPPEISPPPPPTKRPPEISPPPPPSPAQPPKNSPPPPSPKPPPPENPPSPPLPPPLSELPQIPLPSPPFVPPAQSNTTSPPRNPPSLNSTPKSSPPPAIRTSPPPPSVLSPPSRSRPSPPIASPSIPSTNGSSGNAIQNPQSSNGGSGTGGTVAVVLVLVIMFLGIFVTVACCVWKQKKKSSGYHGGYVMPAFLGSSQESDSALLKVRKLAPINVNGSAKGFVYSPRTPAGFGNTKTWFTYEELVEATDEFSALNLLGEGGFGSVYKGSLTDGRDVAVKQLKIGGGQGEREFRSEVEIISRIHHRHLVSLVGYCIYENRRLLVYDYVPNNNLYFHLHSEGRPVLDWATRVKIAIGAARGLAYLHEDCHPRIIHRDIKSSNILLDNNFEAQVSDFGLAKLAIDANTHVTTRVMGTCGYMAPEYASSGKLTEKSDVYSYGVVLLELITGRKPVDTSQPLGEESLVEWARPLLSHALDTHDFSGLADPSLELNYVDCEMFRMIEAAAACVRHSSARRPKMGQVARALDCMDMSDLSNGMKVGESGMFNCAHESEEIRLFRRMAFGCQDYSTGFLRQDCWSIEAGHRVNSRRQMMQ